MSFIGESHKEYASPWGTYVCLEEEDCQMLLKAAKNARNKAEKEYLKWRDIHDGGEMTTRQETAMMEAEDKFNRADGIVNDMMQYLKKEGGQQ